MSIQPPYNGPTGWKNLLSLGEQLLTQTGLANQRELILQTTIGMFTCQADLWLAEQEQMVDSHPKAPTVLMRRAFDEGRILRSTEVDGSPEPLLAPKKRARRQVASDKSEKALPAVMDRPTNGGAHSIALPLITGRQPLGVLQVERPDGPPFDEIEIDILDGLAFQSAIALQTTLTMTRLRERAEHLTSVAEVSNAITSILKLDDLLDNVVALIHNRLGYPFVEIFTVHTGRRKIFYKAGTSPINQQLRQQEFAYELDDLNGIIPWVARQGDSIFANDVSSEPRYRISENLFGISTRSEMTVPLTFAGEVLGILDIQSDRLDAFGEDDRFLIEALADNIAIAIRNANLYRSEQWRRQVADGMREVAGLLTAEADIDRVLEAILNQLEETLPCDIAGIWLVDEPFDPENPQISLASVRCQNTPLCAEDILLAYHKDPGNERWQPGIWLLEALKADAPVVRAADAPYEPLGAVLDFGCDYSAIAAPLRTGDNILGVLTLVHHTSGRYGSEACTITATFSSYAAVAIENTRLYEASHEQAWIATVLLQVSEATQSIADTTELLATVVQIIPMVIGVKTCAAFIWDSHTDTFMPVAAFGLEPEQQAIFETLNIHIDDLPAFDRMRLEKKAVVLQPDDKASLVQDVFQSPSPFLFPLMAHGEIRGAMLVDFEMGSPEMMGDFMHDEKLAILQGIAHQTATAIENIRLLKSQKEEAYVSVALLQVAQAIVSLNDLADILEAVVRIAPILVGVKRCAVFLWDDDHQVFRLSQNYGIAKETVEALKTRTFGPGEFPLLDFVRQNDRLAYYPLSLSPEFPTDWERLEPQDSIGADRADRDDEDTGITAVSYRSELLTDSNRLLLAFPLSVKGKVLAVMLAEEVDPTTDEPSYHVRERRLEIITGITQQASLAIQNDLLQREVVERGRLEREMQLAREIQQTFLPANLPQRDGWDLDVRWRPARQVGGDFYDIFELPKGRIGLVISDVADKGMPAALFMTLIRTLIRATVHDYESPATVLEHVNDLLIPDTQSGLFVTVIYGVLHPQTGLFIYANAGHNLPLLFRQSQRQVSRLSKGNMALGIEPGIHIEEHQVSLEPGDFVLLYTDGVTEAFSPEGLMFGEEKLRQMLGQYENQAAKTILDGIDEAIKVFTLESFPSDDLTLIALKRLP